MFDKSHVFFDFDSTIKMLLSKKLIHPCPKDHHSIMLSHSVKEVLYDATEKALEGKLGDFMVYRCYKEYLKMFYLTYGNEVKHVSEEVIAYKEIKENQQISKTILSESKLTKDDQEIFLIASKCME